MNGAWMVQWIESERGWGQRDDGVFYYATEEKAKQDSDRMVKEQRDREAKIYKGHTPDEYSFPEDPVFVPVSKKLAKEITDKGRVYMEKPEK